MNVTVDEVRELIEGAETMADMESLSNNTPLREQDVDSLDMANILLLLEEKYEVKIPDKDMKFLQTIDDITKYLNQQ